MGLLGFLKLSPAYNYGDMLRSKVKEESCDIGERLIGLGEDARGRRREDGWRKSESGDDGSNGQESSHGDGDELYC